MTEQLERKIIEVIATDRIDVPISSMSGKLKRKKSKYAKAIDLSGYDTGFEGDRAYARLEYEDKQKARGTKEGIAKFEEAHPRYGRILKGMIEEERTARETNLVFGMYDGCRITSVDYMGVMENLGFTPAVAEGLYQNLMDISRKMNKKREETERSILVNSTI